MVDDAARFRGALGMLFAGMLLVLLDFGINGFDLLPDPLGWLLAAVAAGRLREADVDAVYHGRATAAWLLAWVATALSALAVVVVLPTAAGVIYGIVGSVQPVVTALALLRLAQVVDAPRLRRTWQTTVVALVTTLVVTQLVLLTAATTRTDDIGALAVPAVAFFVVAFAHYLLSIHRTRAALGT